MKMLRRRRLFLLYLPLLCARAPVAAAEQAPAPVAPPAVVPAESRITVPITLSLRALYDGAEAQIPQVLSSGDEWITPPGGPSWARLRYTIRRGPLGLKLNGTAIEATTEIAYSLEAKRVSFPPVSVSAGTGDDPPKRARLNLRVDLEVTPAWGLHARSRVKVEPIDRCKVTFLNLDVTDTIRDAAEKHLARLAEEKIDRRLNESSILRDEAVRAWARLQEPLPLAEGLQLRVSPKRFGISGLEGKEDTLRLSAHLACAPEVVGGTPATAEPLPLPDMSPVQAGEAGGFRVVLDGTVPFEEAGRLISRGLTSDPETGKPRVFGKAGFRLRPTGAEVAGSGDRLRLTIPFAGSAKGKLILTGRPRYDAATQCLCADDVAYTVETRNLLARLGMLMFRDTMRRAITRASRWPVQGSLNMAREKLDAALNRELSQGVRLTGKTRAVTPIQVEATDAAFHVRALLEGDLDLQVTPALPQILPAPEPGAQGASGR